MLWHLPTVARCWSVAPLIERHAFGAMDDVWLSFGTEMRCMQRASGPEDQWPGVEFGRWTEKSGDCLDVLIIII